MRWTKILGAALLSLATVLLLAGGCTLSRSGELQQQCTTAAECVLPNACYVAACSLTGQCEFTPVDNSAVLDQEPNDCAVWACVIDGDTAEPQRLASDDDRPDDIVCTTRYRCVDGELSEEGVGPGSICGSIDQGTCQNGDCVVTCDRMDDPNCDDGNDCTNDICNLNSNECEYEALDNIDAPTQTDGDCAVVLCTLGVETEIYDDGDIFDDGSECTTDTCNAGQVVNAPLPQGTDCEGADPLASVCDAMGACVQCNADVECIDFMNGWGDTDCQTPRCMAGTCELMCEPVGTTAAIQSPQPDCHTMVCDGSCGYQDDIDDTDVPDDANDCTDDVCDMGVISHPPEPLNTMCGAAGLCDGNGNCGSCNVDADCQADTFCRDWSCDTVNDPHVCVFTNINDGVDLPAGQSDGDCHTLRCNTGVPEDQIDDVDLPVDGLECTGDECAAGMPTNPALAIDTACSEGMGGRFCDGNGACVNCNDVTQCALSDGICEQDACNANTCEVEFFATTVNAPPSCQSPSADCQVVRCDGAGECGASVPDDLDVVDDGNECTADSCNAGTEVHDSAPVEGNLCTQNGVFCDGAETCQTGVCQTDVVTPACPGHNVGPNCNDSCDETLDDCSAPDVVSTGCGDPTSNECTSADTCDGAGACLDNHTSAGAACGDQGVACTVDDACDGNGVCTDNGFEGSGSPCGDPTDDACTNPDSCDGVGSCLDNHEIAGSACGDQGVECLIDDSCDGAGSCTDNGFESAGNACGDQGIECLVDDACDGAGSCTDNGFESSGSACGDQGITCLVDDSCDGAGTCTDNGFETAGSACGDQGIECLVDDACDGAGSCTDNGFETSGSACGDQGVECLVDDSCDGAGSCTDNGFETSGSACGDQGVECLVDDSCDGAGMCTDNGFSMAGTTCGDATDDECTDPDTCDGGGVCEDNHEPITTSCGDGVTEPTCDPDHCDAGGQCINEPNASNGTLCTENGGVACLGGTCQ